MVLPPITLKAPTAASADVSRRDTQSRSGNSDVRRPLGGATLPDDTYATLSLLSGGALLNTSVESGQSATNTNLLVQSLNFNVAEKHQRVQTFDVDRLFFFGQSLPTLRLEAITLDSLTFQWLQELYENYTTRIAGSIAAENGAKVQLTSDERVYTGYILDLSFSKSAQSRATATVSITMSLSRVTHLRELRSTFFGGNDSSSLQTSLAEISADLSSAPSASADETTSLASQVPAATGKESAVRSGGVPLREIYVNEYLSGSTPRVTTRNPEPRKRKPTLKALEPIIELSPGITQVEELLSDGKSAIVTVPDWGSIAAQRVDEPVSVRPLGPVFSPDERVAAERTMESAVDRYEQSANATSAQNARDRLLDRR